MHSEVGRGKAREREREKNTNFHNYSTKTINMRFVHFVVGGNNNRIVKLYSPSERERGRPTLAHQVAHLALKLL